MKMDVAVGQLDRVYCLPDSLISCAMGYILFAVQEVSGLEKALMMLFIGIPITLAFFFG